MYFLLSIVTINKNTVIPDSKWMSMKIAFIAKKRDLER